MWPEFKQKPPVNALEGQMPDAWDVTNFSFENVGVHLASWSTYNTFIVHHWVSRGETVLLLGFQTCVISTAYLAARNCLQWGERNVRHVSLRNRVFIWKKKNHSIANGNVNLSALFLKINIYKEFPIWEEPKRPKIFLSMKSLTAGLSGKMLSSSAKGGENIPARFKD